MRTCSGRFDADERVQRVDAEAEQRVDEAAGDTCAAQQPDATAASGISAPAT